MKRAVIVQDGMGMAGVAESPIKASVDSSESWKGEGDMRFKRFITNDVGIGGFVVAVIGSDGSVSVGHLSG